jgi:hypothetical protein
MREMYLLAAPHSFVVVIGVSVFAAPRSILDLATSRFPLQTTQRFHE